VIQRPEQNGAFIEVETDRPFTLEFVRKGRTRRFECPLGRSRLRPDAP